MRDAAINFRDAYNAYNLNMVSLEAVVNTGAPQTQDRWLDNFVISTTRIGCDVSTATSDSGTKSYGVTYRGVHP